MSHEKDLNMSVYYDFYSAFLTKKQKRVFELYYNEDLSLAEISIGEGITRQAVRDCILRACQKMIDMESKLNLIKSEIEGFPPSKFMVNN